MIIETIAAIILGLGLMFLLYAVISSAIHQEHGSQIGYDEKDFDFDKCDEESNQDQIDNTAKIGDNNV